MKSIILAAGIGSRLSPITSEKPKALIEINGKPILSYMINSLRKFGINNIVICVGYKSEQIVNFCKKNYPRIKFTFVKNRDFNTTNNMYSLYLARKHLSGDILLMNGDVICEPMIIGKLIKQKRTTVAVDRSVYKKESMKIMLNREKVIKRISKAIKKKNSYGCSIDMYKIIRDDANVLKKKLIDVIEKNKKLNQWTETLLDNLFEQGKIISYPFDISGRKWYEIDNFNDLVAAEILFNKKIISLNKKKIFFLDKDGTMSLGNKIINGSHKLFEKLKQEQKFFYLLSNNSSKTPKEHLKTFSKLGFNLTLSNVLTSTQNALTYMKQKKFKRVFWVANKNVSNYIKKNGFVYDEINPELVLLTYDTEITYDKLVKLCNIIRKNIPYYATHTDIVCPTPNGAIPDIGSFIELIRLTTGKIPQKTFGKPDKSLIKFALDKNGLKNKDAVIVGDRLYTDIQLGRNAGITSVLVLSGETNRANYEKSKTKADIVINNIKDLIKFV